MKKVCFVFILIICLCFTFVTPVMANGSIPDFSWSSIQGKVSSFESSATAKSFNASGLINSIANILMTIGIVVVLAGILIVGIMYMNATPEQASKLKTKLVGLAIAGVVIVGSYGIWTFVKNFLENVT